MAKQPKRARTSAQDKLYAWVLRSYFAYIEEKGRLGGFPHEGELRVLSASRFAPEVSADVLQSELVKQFWRTIWTLDPIRRPAEAKESPADTEDDEEADEAHASEGDGDAEASSSDEAPPRFEEKWDLFSVAGVTMPPSFTVPDANVPGGYRRVGRRFGTWRIYDQHVLVEELKAQEQTEHAKRSRDRCARVLAAIGQERIDQLLWDCRDRKPADEDDPEARPDA